MSFTSANAWTKLDLDYPILLKFDKNQVRYTILSMWNLKSQTFWGSQLLKPLPSIATIWMIFGPRQIQTKLQSNSLSGMLFIRKWMSTCIVASSASVTHPCMTCDLYHTITSQQVANWKINYSKNPPPRNLTFNIRLQCELETKTKTFKAIALKVKTILMFDLHCTAYTVYALFLQYRKVEIWVEISRSIFCTYKNLLFKFQAD